MNLIDAYTQALNEDDDIPQRSEFSRDDQLKTYVVEEIIDAMKEIRTMLKDKPKDQLSLPAKVELIQPMFNVVAFWFIHGIRVGQILRDAERDAEVIADDSPTYHQ